MKTEFSSFKEWKAAALTKGLVLERTYPSHEGPHESDMWEPSFCGKYLPRTFEYPEEEAFMAYGMFSADWAEDGKDAVWSGFIFDTSEEMEAECVEQMVSEHKDIEAAADRLRVIEEGERTKATPHTVLDPDFLTKKDSPTPTLDKIVRDCEGPTNELNAQPQDWPTAWRNGNDPD